MDAFSPRRWTREGWQIEVPPSPLLPLARRLPPAFAESLPADAVVRFAGGRPRGGPLDRQGPPPQGHPFEEVGDV